MRWLTTILAALALEGCTCTDHLAWAVGVKVRDAVTDGLLSSTPTVILTDGRYRETLDEAWVHPASATHRVVGGWGRGGTYDVEVRAPGYRTWKEDDVRVREDRCGHPQGVWLEVRMVPRE